MRYTWGSICKEGKEIEGFKQKTYLIRRDFTSWTTSQVKEMWFLDKRDVILELYEKEENIINQFVHTMINNW